MIDAVLVQKASNATSLKYVAATVPPHHHCVTAVTTHYKL